MALTLRYMRLADVPTVVAIDRVSFGAPWSARSFAYEVSQSTYSHMVALELAPELPQQKGLRRLTQFLNGTPPADPVVVSYGGLWHIADEAHISTIATDPAQRGHGYGELALAAMIRRALTLGSAYIVLEVRVSNTVAQNLYLKYSFQVVDRKANYYHNDGEDAYDMRLSFSEQPNYAAQFEQRYAALLTRYRVRDEYSAVTPPRGQT